jgi:hypothetical protein
MQGLDFILSRILWSDDKANHLTGSKPKADHLDLVANLTHVAAKHYCLSLGVSSWIPCYLRLANSKYRLRMEI